MSWDCGWLFPGMTGVIVIVVYVVAYGSLLMDDFNKKVERKWDMIAINNILLY